MWAIVVIAVGGALSLFGLLVAAVFVVKRRNRSKTQVAASDDSPSDRPVLPASAALADGGKGPAAPQECEALKGGDGEGGPGGKWAERRAELKQQQEGPVALHVVALDGADDALSGVADSGATSFRSSATLTSPHAAEQGALAAAVAAAASSSRGGSPGPLGASPQASRPGSAASARGAVPPVAAAV